MPLRTVSIAPAGLAAAVPAEVAVAAAAVARHVIYRTAAAVARHVIYMTAAVGNRQNTMASRNQTAQVCKAVAIVLANSRPSKTAEADKRPDTLAVRLAPNITGPVHTHSTRPGTDIWRDSSSHCRTGSSHLLGPSPMRTEARADTHSGVREGLDNTVARFAATVSGGFSPFRQRVFATMTFSMLSLPHNSPASPCRKARGNWLLRLLHHLLRLVLIQIQRRCDLSALIF